MSTIAHTTEGAGHYPVGLLIRAEPGHRDRLTTAFRPILAIPHLILVGGPLAALTSVGWTSETGWTWEWSWGTGALGAVAGVAALIAWFAILFTQRHPDGLWNLAAYYLRWRIRALSYLMLLRDEYPPFGEGSYPIELELPQPEGERDRLTVAFRIVLAIPHLIALWVLGMVWALATILAWFAILLTGRYPQRLYDFSLGVLGWGARVEAYVLLLRDEYPPFALQ